MVTRVPKRSASSTRPAVAALSLTTLVLAVSASGCPCAAAVTDASPGLRWFLFSNFGASKICPEMLKLGVSLKLQDRAPAVGRFFPMQCSYNVNDSSQTVTVHFAGTGYGYMMPAKRVGFSCTGSIEFRPDFQIAGENVYVWGRLNRIIQGPNFQLGYVENPVFDVAANIPPFGTIANFFGNQVVASELTRGFTVVHNDDRGNDFSLGILVPPQKPHHPFNVTATERFTFANETVDVHGNQRDYLGPFEITDSGQKLYLTVSVTGPAIDVIVVDKFTGDHWREAYQTGKPLGPPPGPIVAGGPLQPGGAQNLSYSFAPGMYYVVLDNSSYAGTANPPFMPFNPLSDPVARVSYVAQVGD
jgi:hypothetical protein